MFRELYRCGRTSAAVAVLGLVVILFAQPGSPARGQDPAQGWPTPAMVEQHVRAGLSAVFQRTDSDPAPLGPVTALLTMGIAGIGAAGLVRLGLAPTTADRLRVLVGSLWRRAERAPPTHLLA